MAESGESSPQSHSFYHNNLFNTKQPKIYMIKLLEEKRIFAIILTLLMAIEIFYFSSIIGVKGPEGGLNLSIIYHFVAFFLLSFFLMISIVGQKEIKVKYIMTVLLISITYSLLDEFHQFFVPGRFPDVFDIFTDGTGIFSSMILYLYSRKLS